MSCTVELIARRQAYPGLFKPVLRIIEVKFADIQPGKVSRFNWIHADPVNVANSSRQVVSIFSKVSEQLLAPLLTFFPGA